MTNPALIRSNGSGQYYIAHGIMRSKKEYKTINGAVRAAKERGYDPVTVDPCCDPNLISVAHLCSFVQMPTGQCLRVELDKYSPEKPNETLEFRGADAIKLANEFFPKMGFKPVRLTRNSITGNGKEFLVDADTPSYCDPGSEAYHSM